MKIGVIVELLRQPLFDGITTAAELGVQGIQLHAVCPEHDLTTFSPEQLKEIKEHCDNAGLAITAVCGDLPGHGFQRAADNPARIATTKKIIDLTRILGSRIVTTHIGVIPTDSASEIYSDMLTALSELGRYAMTVGAVLAIETGPEPATVLKAFVDAAGPGVGVNLDPANLVMVLDADPVGAVNLLGPRIVHTHAKDGIHYRKCDPARVYGAFAEGGFERLVAETGELFMEVPLGQGQVPWERYLQALRQTGFDGYLTIEREVGGTPRADIATAAAFLHHKLSKLQ